MSNQQVDREYKIFIDNNKTRWIYYRDWLVSTSTWDAWQFYCSLASWKLSPAALAGVVLDLGEE